MGENFSFELSDWHLCRTPNCMRTTLSTRGATQKGVSLKHVPVRPVAKDGWEQFLARLFCSCREGRINHRPTRGGIKGLQHTQGKEGVHKGTSSPPTPPTPLIREGHAKSSRRKTAPREGSAQARREEMSNASKPSPQTQSGPKQRPPTLLLLRTTNKYGKRPKRKMPGGGGGLRRRGRGGDEKQKKSNPNTPAPPSCATRRANVPRTDEPAQQPRRKTKKSNQNGRMSPSGALEEPEGMCVQQRARTGDARTEQARKKSMKRFAPLAPAPPFPCCASGAQRVGSAVVRLARSCLRRTNVRPAALHGATSSYILSLGGGVLQSVRGRIHGSARGSGGSGGGGGGGREKGGASGRDGERKRSESGGGRRGRGRSTRRRRHAGGGGRADSPARGHSRRTGAGRGRWRRCQWRRKRWQRGRCPRGQPVRGDADRHAGKPRRAGKHRQARVGRRPGDLVGQWR